MTDSKMTDSEMGKAWFNGALWKNLWRKIPINHKEDIADKLRAKYESGAVEVYD